MVGLLQKEVKAVGQSETLRARSLAPLAKTRGIGMTFLRRMAKPIRFLS